MILKWFENGSSLYIMVWTGFLIFTEREIRTRKTIVVLTERHGVKHKSRKVDFRKTE